MSLNTTLVDPGPDIYYTKQFRDVLEDHMVLLREHPNTKPMTIMPGESFQWRNDLFGLLSSKNIPRHLHWVIMRLNNYTSPRQFTTETMLLLVPDSTVLEKIRQSHNSSARIS